MHIDREKLTLAQLQVLALRIETGEVVCVVFDQKVHLGRFGTGDTFLLRRGRGKSEIEKFASLNYNDIYLIAQADSLVVGSSDTGSALTLRQDLIRAATAPCQ